MLFLPWLRAAETTWKRLSFLLSSHRNSLKWCVVFTKMQELKQQDRRTQQTCQERKNPTCTTFTSIMLHSRDNSGGDFGTTKIILTVWLKLVISLPLKWLLLRRGRGLWSLTVLCRVGDKTEERKRNLLSVWNGMGPSWQLNAIVCVN